MRLNILSVALLAALLSSTVTAQDVPTKEASGVPRPPAFIALDRLNQLSPRQPSRAEISKECTDEINAAMAFYSAQQSDPATAVPSEVIRAAKGMVIIDAWSVGALVSETQGHALGFSKKADGSFGNPAFYTIGNSGYGTGVSHTRIIAYLMTDKAMHALLDNRFQTGLAMQTVAGGHYSTTGPFAESSDDVFYQTDGGLYASQDLAGFKLAADDQRNHRYYAITNMSPAQIYARDLSLPDAAEALVATINEPINQSRVVARNDPQ